MSAPGQPLTVEQVTARLRQLEDTANTGNGGRVPMRDLFALAREFTTLDPTSLERLLTHADHNPRMVAVSIMDFAARRKTTPTEHRGQLYDLYLNHHDRINTWAMVDRAAPHVVGGWLWDKPRQPLHQLAASPHWWERRTAIVATWYFIRLGDLDDTYAIASALADDPHHLVQKAVGGWVREAGKRDPQRLRDYLDQHAATLPRTALRYAIEHLDPATRHHYLTRRAAQDTT
jgi:3-methyladenine DNA glycosylase AlkD